jgi:pimeloyl-ACP methyl ester carboxylesterase
MRFVWMAVVLSTLGVCLGREAAAAPEALPLHECRLENPQRLGSIAARCGVLTVPLDRAQPQGATIDLSIAVVPALNRRATAAPLFLLAGGPGQGAAAMYTGLSSAFARVNRNHDIVLVDQRGTGSSSPLNCDYPEDWLALDEVLPALKVATQACLQKYGQRVRFYTTSAAVQDLEAVRQALKFTAIDLYGVSYGTRVAQLYMRRYPAAVHAVILDGVTYPEQAIGPDTPADGERALELIVARCAESADCAKAYPKLQQDLDELRRRFGPQKSALVIDDPSRGTPLSIEFNRSMLNAALRFLSYSANQASLLPTLIHGAAAGALAPLAAQTIMTARQVGDQLASGMQNTVVCSEDVPF